MATKTQRSDSEAETTKTAAQGTRRRSPQSLNEVGLIGRLTRDPEIHHSPRGLAVTRLRLANNGTDDVQYYTIVCFRRLAEIAAEHLSKGRLVYIGGRLTSRTWTASDGTRRYALEIIANKMQFLSPKPASTRAAA